MTYRSEGPCLVVPAWDARFVAAAMRAMQRDLRRDGQALPPQVRQLLEAAEALAASSPGSATEPEHVIWMPVAQAAALLGLTERRVRAMTTLRRRKVGRRVMLAKVDVLDEVETRLSEANGFRNEHDVA